jgi:hypothetical protein
MAQWTIPTKVKGSLNQGRRTPVQRRRQEVSYYVPGMFNAHANINRETKGREERQGQSDGAVRDGYCGGGFATTCRSDSAIRDKYCGGGFAATCRRGSAIHDKYCGDNFATTCGRGSAVQDGYYRGRFATTCRRGLGGERQR